jgi:transposase
MHYKYYIGVDVSKHTLDFTILKDGDVLLHETVKNKHKDIQAWLKKVMTSHKAGGKRTLFCIENTGLYTAIIQKELVRRSVPLWLEGPLQIHLSMGMQRGKSDKIDSYRIAQYAYTHRDKARLWQQPREVIENLKKLRSLRERLVTVLEMMKRELHEVTNFAAVSTKQVLLLHCKDSLATLKIISSFKEPPFFRVNIENQMYHFFMLID